MDRFENADREPNRYFWDVKFWWHDGRNTIESGGHFMYEPGDTIQSVLATVMLSRGIEDKRFTSVEIYLRSDDYSWSRR